MSWKRTAVFVVSGLIAVTVIVVAYVDKAKEPVWMEGARTLSPVPVTVSVANTIGFAKEMSAAVAEINRAVGCRVLQLQPGDGSGATINFIAPETRDACPGQRVEVLEPHEEAGLYPCADGTMDVVIQRLPDITTAYLVFQHEIGHGFWLTHDPTGLMAAFPRWSNEMPLPLPTLSPKDAAAIRQRYCP